MNKIQGIKEIKYYKIIMILIVLISFNNNLLSKHQNNKFSQDDNIFDFPSIYPIEINKPSSGFYFFEKNYMDYSFIIISNNEGEIIFSRKYNENIHNFSLQPNGYLSYYSLNDICYYVMDSSYNVVDRYSMKNNYTTDSHEFILLDNGHSFMMAYDHQIVDMSKIIEGGYTDATAVGLIIQELDENKNVVFEWKSWDHFKITDADTSNIDLKNQYIDYVHGNSLCIESDTSLLLSSRSLNEITKIHRINGEIIWRLGGYNNQFYFKNDSGFARQHAISRLENGNILLFDNGPNTRNYSRGAEYHIDEDSMTISLVHEFRHIPDIISPLMGSAQRLKNGNTLIGWGKNTGFNILTEFDKDGNIVNDLVSEDNIKSYRVLKHTWNTNIFKYNIDTLYFDTVEIHHEKNLKITIKNNLDDTIVFYGYNRGYHPYYITNLFPINLGGKESIEINIKFLPREINMFNNSIVLYSDYLSKNNEPQRITAQINAKGVSKEITTSVSNQNLFKKNTINIYPNPVKNYIYVQSPYLINYISIYNELGENIYFKNVNKSTTRYKIDLIDIIPGIYLIHIIDESGNIEILKFIKTR